MRALISVSDKTGVVEFARGLERLNWEIISTGGTLKLLNDNGVKAKSVTEVTEFPECLDGRVKTLHPKIHGGILNIRDNDDHRDQINRLGIESIDMVVVNLYPFKNTVMKRNCSLEEAIENIDIGGPAMLRSAAKNHRYTLPICDIIDYDMILQLLDEKGEVDYRTRYKLALKAFNHTAAYDGTIAAYLMDRDEELSRIENYPEQFTMTFEKIQTLRYGENPHQQGVYYKDVFPQEDALINAKKIHGKELSFNNINDLQGAVACLREFSGIAVVAVKHSNPCGIGVGSSILEAYEKAYSCDPTSIFGGVVACNRAVDEKTAEKMNEIFLEIIIAPQFTDEALAILTKKKNLRLMTLKELDTGYEKMKESRDRKVDIKRVDGGILIQDVDDTLINKMDVVTKKEPTGRELSDMKIAMKAVKHTRSNGIVIVKDGMTIGIGPGQTNRIWALKNAIKQSEFSTEGAVVASDAFFPFDDCVTACGEAGISAIIQPGGSVRDEDSIRKADELGIAMVFTGQRHFKH